MAESKNVQDFFCNENMFEVYFTPIKDQSIYFNICPVPEANTKNIIWGRGN